MGSKLCCANELSTIQQAPRQRISGNSGTVPLSSMGNDSSVGDEDHEELANHLNNNLSFSCRLLPLEGMKTDSDKKVQRRYSISEERAKRSLTIVHEEDFEESLAQSNMAKSRTWQNPSYLSLDPTWELPTAA